MKKFKRNRVKKNLFKRSIKIFELRVINVLNNIDVIGIVE